MHATQLQTRVTLEHAAIFSGKTFCKQMCPMLAALTVRKRHTVHTRRT